MNRLRDQAAEDPASERMLDLLRETPPAPRMPDLKRRVWGSIQMAHAPGMSPSRLPGLKTAATAVAIVALAGTAGAVISGRWIVPALEGSAPSMPTQRPERSRAIRRIAGLPAPASVAVATPRSVAPRSVSMVTPAADHGAARSSVAPAKTIAVAVSRERTEIRERAEVLDALIALRRDRQPQRAGTLLDRYLSAHPRGVLREEALALAMEAADARNDRTAAQRLARSYQAEFPGGRFRPFARSHTESSLDGAPSGTAPAPTKD